MSYTANTLVIRDVLNKLKISYRMKDFSDSVLYFCTLPNRLTFNLLEKEGGSVKLWRFVGSATLEKANTKCEYRKWETPQVVVGVEITDEGDIVFYAEDVINANESEKEKMICRLLEEYSNIISNTDFENMKM